MKKIYSLCGIIVLIVISLSFTACGPEESDFMKSPYTDILNQNLILGKFQPAPTGLIPSVEAMACGQDDFIRDTEFRTYFVEYAEAPDDFYTVGYLDETVVSGLTVPNSPSNNALYGYATEEAVIDGKYVEAFFAEKTGEAQIESIVYYQFQSSEKIPHRIGQRIACVVLRSKNFVVSECVNTDTRLNRTIKIFIRQFMTERSGALVSAAEPDSKVGIENAYFDRSGSFLLVTSEDLEQTEMINGTDWADVCVDTLRRHARVVTENGDRAVTLAGADDINDHRSGFGRYASQIEKMKLKDSENLYEYESFKTLIIEESRAPRRCDTI